MKPAIVLLLLAVCSVGCTVISNSRCRPGDVKTDSCGNLCRCLGDGVQTTCTKIFCSAFEKIPPSPEVSQLWESLFTVSKRSGVLFDSSSASGKKKLRASLMMLK